MKKTVLDQIKLIIFHNKHQHIHQKKKYYITFYYTQLP